MNRFKQFLKDKGKTFRDIKDSTGITAVTLSSITYGRSNPSLGTLIKIAQALDVSIHEVVDAVIDRNTVNERLICDKSDAEVNIIANAISQTICSSETLKMIAAEVSMRLKKDSGSNDDTDKK